MGIVGNGLRAEVKSDQNQITNHCYALVDVTRNFGYNLTRDFAWIRLGKIIAPSVRLVKGKAVRVWNASDIKKLRAVKSEIYGQGKGKRRTR